MGFAGEFFHSTKSIAAIQQREHEAQSLGEGSIDSPLLLEQEMVTDPSKQIKLGFVSGLLQRDKSTAFERILFRATRGNVFLKQAVVEEPIRDPSSGEKVEKNVFVIFYSGERAKNKIVKICETFAANQYPFADDTGKRFQMITEVSGRLLELKTTIDVGLLHQASLLQDIAHQFEHWSLLVKKEKSMYHTLNMLSIDVTKKCLVAEGCCPVSATTRIQNALQRATLDCNSQVGAIVHVLHTEESPPTYFCTNKFTTAFQEIVDAYGVAKYQEANPGVYTIITFPFLFAVMFGDWGHGICLLMATLYFIFREKSLSNQKLGDITGMIFGGRYVILMMALFSIYTGLIYNEFFSVTFDIFGPSAYACRDLSCRDASALGLIKVHATYPFGVDPVWHGTRKLRPPKWLTDDCICNALLQVMLLLLALAAVPWMLFPKPFILKKQHEERHRGQSYAILHSVDDPLKMDLHPNSHSHEEFEFSEVFVHQLIHTIEFVLGAVSNTASYLRLWALSLAHSELSGVFYDKVLLLAWQFNNTLVLIIGIIVFINATVGVLLVMETLSAFLHALRLHWVEFPNKFYEGDGYKFQPFSFTSLSEEDE